MSGVYRSEYGTVQRQVGHRVASADFGRCLMVGIQSDANVTIEDCIVSALAFTNEPVQISTSMPLTMTPKTLIAISVVMLAAAGVFGFLNTQKAKALRDNLVNVTSARDDAERRRAADQKQIKEREAATASAAAKITDNENRVATAEAD